MIKQIDKFSLPNGRKISSRYTVLDYLGGGYEGEVYKVVENLTKKERAIKLFYPKRNPQFKVSIRYAKKLDKLRDSPIVMDYLTHEIIKIRNTDIAVLVSEYIEGEILGNFVERQKGKRKKVRSVSSDSPSLLHSLRN